MFNPSREEVRRFFCDAWDKHVRRLPATPLESIAIDWMIEHPEYQDLLSRPEDALQSEFTGDDGQGNPFLHLSMHLSIAEQVSIDQPPGIRAAYEALRSKAGSDHEASHVIMECLGQTIWQAQRDRSAPDSDAYVDCIRRRAS